METVLWVLQVALDLSITVIFVQSIKSLYDICACAWSISRSLNNTIEAMVFALEQRIGQAFLSVLNVVPLVASMNDG